MTILTNTITNNCQHRNIPEPITSTPKKLLKNQYWQL
jgi:hypothetical protein